MKVIVKSAIVAASLLAASGAYAQDGLALANSKACMACHNVDAKVIGPAFKEIAAKYAGDAATVAASIKNGSTGKWGPVPMPANPVSDDEAKTLADWILSLK
ncbi:c-type cytochrome [Pelistega suis]|uniref:C-type cytochrome n=1 Tax=Pelistega suis TaxID=1631957 RepID=A0A849P7A9_9BURK|nr:c-type cytochrome [Pelistega suis]MDY3330555.1 c-type cytochrome [Pelistega sp.]NOL52471.1 c-type cytochrome [Pelistega suis]